MRSQGESQAAMALAAMEPLFLNVERSIVPGLMRIPVVRCLPGPRALLAPPPQPAAFEVPDSVDPSTSVGEAVPEASAEVSHGGFCAPEFGFESRVGGNVLTCGFYGLFSTLLRPGLRRLERRAGSVGQLVNIATSASLFGLSCAAAGAFGQTAAALGRVVSRVPILGSSGPFGQALQMGLGTLIGNKFGALFAPERVAEKTLDEVFLANMCVMCNTGLEVGSGLRVAALTCGHACLCIQSETESCVATYLARRGDCPLCREADVEVAHEIRL